MSFVPRSKPASPPSPSRPRRAPRPESEGSRTNRSAPQNKKSLPLIPLREAVLFPQALAPLSVGRESSLTALEEATRRGRHILVTAQRDPGQDEISAGDIYEWGTLAEIEGDRSASVAVS